MMLFVLKWVEDNVGKGENVGYQHFLPEYFLPVPLVSKAFPLR